MLYQLSYFRTFPYSITLPKVVHFRNLGKKSITNFQNANIVVIAAFATVKVMEKLCRVIFPSFLLSHPEFFHIGSTK